MNYTAFLKQLIELTGIDDPSTFRTHVGGWLFNKDRFIDFPTAGQDDIPYRTHMPIENKEIQEQSKEELPEEEPTSQGVEGMPPGGGMPGGEGMPGEMDPAMAGMDPSMDPTAQQLSANQIGRVYELKKIYTRLLSIETYITRSTDDPIIADLRKKVGEAINLYEVVISNYEQYKDNIDDIIIQFYKFLDKLHETLKKHFRVLRSKENK